jgi:hypothetical protein
VRQILTISTIRINHIISTNKIREDLIEINRIKMKRRDLSSREGRDLIKVRKKKNLKKRRLKRKKILILK